MEKKNSNALIAVSLTALSLVSLTGCASPLQSFEKPNVSNVSNVENPTVKMFEDNILTGKNNYNLDVLTFSQEFDDGTKVNCIIIEPLNSKSVSCVPAAR